MPRDSFKDVTTILDMAVASTLDTQRGQLLADYLVLLKRSLPHLSSEDAARTSSCDPGHARRLSGSHSRRDGRRVSPDPAHIHGKGAAGGSQELLRSPSLGPDRLCREAGMSRSQLYRVLEQVGGVANYIKRCRLAESFALLSDVSNSQAINEIAEISCFSDASTFQPSFSARIWRQPRRCTFGSALRHSGCTGSGLQAPAERP